MRISLFISIAMLAVVLFVTPQHARSQQLTPEQQLPFPPTPPETPQEAIDRAQTAYDVLTEPFVERVTVELIQADRRYVDRFTHEIDPIEGAFRMQLDTVLIEIDHASVRFADTRNERDYYAATLPADPDLKLALSKLALTASIVAKTDQTLPNLPSIPFQIAAGGGIDAAFDVIPKLTMTNISNTGDVVRLEAVHERGTALAFFGLDNGFFQAIHVHFADTKETLKVTHEPIPEPSDSDRVPPINTQERTRMLTLGSLGPGEADLSAGKQFPRMALLDPHPYITPNEPANAHSLTAAPTITFPSVVLFTAAPLLPDERVIQALIGVSESTSVRVVRIVDPTVDIQRDLQDTYGVIADLPFAFSISPASTIRRFAKDAFTVVVQVDGQGVIMNTIDLTEPTEESLETLRNLMQQ